MNEPGGDSHPDDADRRRAQRIHLDDRPAGQFDAKPVQSVDLGLSGLRISSSHPFSPGHFGELAWGSGLRGPRREGFFVGADSHELPTHAERAVDGIDDRKTDSASRRLHRAGIRNRPGSANAEKGV